MLTNTTTMDYFQKIRDCANEGTNFLIYNGEAKHAAFLFTTFFKTATNEVDIYTGELYPEIFDKNQELIASAITFLQDNENAKLKIAYQFDTPPGDILNRKIVQEIIANQLGDKLEVWDARKSFINDHEPFRNHFALMDGTAYRYEKNHADSKAIANFGDKELASGLSVIFKGILNTSERITLPA